MTHWRKIILAAALVLMALFAISTPAGARYDPQWKWRTVTTENFIVYYPEGHEAFARRVLALAPEVHRDVSGYFGTNPGRLPVVLNPGTDIFNGFYSPFPNRISLFETPLYTTRGFGSSTSDIVDLVYTHEYTHYAHITARFGLYRFMTTLFGEGVGVLNAVSPGWMIEGITTNTETLFTDGGRGRSPEFKGEMRSFTDRGGLWNLSAAGTSPLYGPPGSRFYLAGYHMVDYLNRTYGRDSFARLTRYQGTHPFRFANGALSHVTRKSSSEFYREFLADFNARADSIRAAVRATGLPEGSILLAEPLDSFDSHFWTPEGRIRVLRTGYDHGNALVEADPAAGKTVRVLRLGALHALGRARPLSDGRLLFSEPFIRPFGEMDLDTTDLVALDPETGNRERLTRNAHTYAPAVSPDGKTIIVVARNGMWDDLLLLDSDGRNLRPLVSRAGLFWDAPAWSPDGASIAAVLKEGGDNAPALVDVRTGNIRTVFAPGHNGYGNPGFSADGRWLVFTSDLSGVWNVYARNMESGNTFRLTAVPCDAEEPCISPDGRTISFLTLSRGVKQLRVMPFSPEAGEETAFPPGGEFVPSASPDEAGEIPESRGIPLSAYKPYLHVPMGGADEDGSTLGLLFLGGDPVGINSYSAQALYGLKSRRFGYDVSLANRSFWPDITLRAYDSPLEGNTVGGGGDAWYRERGAEVSLGLPVIHRIVPSAVTASYRAGARVRRFDGLEKITIDKRHDLSTALFGEIGISRIPATAVRDLTPGWGQAFFLSHEGSLEAFGGELPGHNTVARLIQYSPSPFRHHGFRLSIAHQNQRGRLHYNARASIPRGYTSDDTEGGFNLDNTLTASLEYQFPILYVDRGFGMTLLHFHILRGSLFADHGAGWNGGFRRETWARNARSSLGATLWTSTTTGYVLPLDFGMAAGYNPVEDEWFAYALFGVTGMGSAAKGEIPGFNELRRRMRW